MMKFNRTLSSQAMALAGLLVSATVAWADPVACTKGTYDQYEKSDFSCTVGSLTFSNFTLMSTDLMNTDITVTPLATGLKLGFNLTVSSMQQSEKSATFSYEVGVGNKLAIGGAAIELTGRGMDAGVTSQVTETFSGRDETLKAFQITPTGFDDTKSQFDQNVALPGSPTSLEVTDTAQVSTIATGAVRTAFIDSVSNTFAAVPEPGEFYLFGIGGLCTIGYRFWRRRQQV